MCAVYQGIKEGIARKNTGMEDSECGGGGWCVVVSSVLYFYFVFVFVLFCSILFCFLLPIESIAIHDYGKNEIGFIMLMIVPDLCPN